jgi:hypothetical protein
MRSTAQSQVAIDTDVGSGSTNLDFGCMSPGTCLNANACFAVSSSSLSSRPPSSAWHNRFWPVPPTCRRVIAAAGAPGPSACCQGRCRRASAMAPRAALPVLRRPLRLSRLRREMRICCCATAALLGRPCRGGLMTAADAMHQRAPMPRHPMHHAAPTRLSPTSIRRDCAFSSSTLIE